MALEKKNSEKLIEIMVKAKCQRNIPFQELFH